MVQLDQRAEVLRRQNGPGGKYAGAHPVYGRYAGAACRGLAQAALESKRKRRWARSTSRSLECLDLSTTPSRSSSRSTS
eukprot:5797913-Heterocapsa_arctica.AAC.1